MDTRRRAFTRLGIFLLGLSALLVVGVALKKPLLEEWHIRRLESTDPAQRNAAAARLGDMKSIRAIPALVRAVGRVRGKPYYGERFEAVFPSTEAAATSLIAIGSPAIPAILGLFKSNASEVHEVAAEMLGEISPDGTTMLPHLLAVIEDLDAFGPWEASVALVAIGLPAVPAVLGAFEADDASVRRNAARVLTSHELYTPSVITALLIPGLNKLLKDEESSVREAAEEARDSWLVRIPTGRRR